MRASVRSAFKVAEAREVCGGRLLSSPQLQRLREIFEVGHGWDNFARSPEPLQRFALRQRCQHRYWPSTVRDLNRFAAFDATQKFTRALPQLPYPHTCHVLFIAHQVLVGGGIDGLGPFAGSSELVDPDDLPS